MSRLTAFQLFIRQALLYPLTAPFLPAVDDVRVGVIYSAGQLTGTLKNMNETYTVGEAITAGQICYLKSDGKMWKAKADVYNTSSFLLGIATTDISAEASGSFLIEGDYTDSSLTTGSIYYLSVSTAGQKTLTRPTTAGNIVRILGYATSPTNFFFRPDTTYIKI